MYSHWISRLTCWIECYNLRCQWSKIVSCETVFAGSWCLLITGMYHSSPMSCCNHFCKMQMWLSAVIRFINRILCIAGCHVTYCGLDWQTSFFLRWSFCGRYSTRSSVTQRYIVSLGRHQRCWPGEYWNNICCWCKLELYCAYIVC